MCIQFHSKVTDVYYLGKAIYPRRAERTEHIFRLMHSPAANKSITAADVVWTQPTSIGRSLQHVRRDGIKY